MRVKGGSPLFPAGRRGILPVEMTFSPISPSSSAISYVGGATRASPPPAAGGDFPPAPAFSSRTWFAFYSFHVPTIPIWNSENRRSTPHPAA